MEENLFNEKSWTTYDGVEKIEIRLLLEGIFLRYGYDFRNYSYSSLRRRIWHRIKAEKLRSISELTEKVLHNPIFMERLLADFSINVTEMFRDPSFFSSFRKNVVPLLRSYPVIRIWHAGCSTGEEVYSMAITLKEEGLLGKCKIYATDMNKNVLEIAKSRKVPLEKMRKYTYNYHQAGGEKDFSKYYSVQGNFAILDQSLTENVVFAQHNLVTDGSFNEFNLILCRNVLIYFNNELRDQVHDLFYQSLSRFGILALGDKESIRFTQHAQHFEEVLPTEKFYRKTK
ncbi:CheR family methyltransferase [Salirhabdus salicampi]|uniref:CheR family methyltransferase n=1 Tax=Salirhabdus salicampi TaxID=476102 RepID=UPI0020C31F98|nr:protein-glutamate O-methyltransferase CheR [Salirhabdus salicampi]